MGDTSIATGLGAIALGEQQTAIGNGAVALGDPNNAYGNGAVAIGENNNANTAANPMSGTIAMGSGNTALGAGSVALGLNSFAGVEGSTAGAVAIGNTASAAFDNAVAIGSGATVTRAGNVALGSGSTAGAANVGAYNVITGDSTNIAAATTAATNVVSVGAPGAERQIQNVAAGVVSASSTDAVNGSQLYAVGQATNNLGATTAAALGGGSTYKPGVGVTAPSYKVQGNTYNNVGSALGALDSALYGMGSSIGVLSENLAATNNRVNNNQREARQGIAIAFTAAQATMPSAPGRTSWILNAGAFKGYTAISGSVAHRLPTAMPLAVTATASMGTANSVAVKGGLQGEF